MNNNKNKKSKFFLVGDTGNIAAHNSFDKNMMGKYETADGEEICPTVRGQ